MSGSLTPNSRAQETLTNGKQAIRTRIYQEPGDVLKVDVIPISESFDAIDFTYPDQKTEIFKYYSGGIGGNLVATVTVTYYDTGKRKIKSLSKV